MLTYACDYGLKAVITIFVNTHIHFQIKRRLIDGKPPVNNLARLNQRAVFLIILLLKSQCSLLQKRFLYLSEE